MRRSAGLLRASMVLLVLTGVGLASGQRRGTSPATSAPPSLPPPALLEPGVLFSEVTLVRGDIRQRLWIYLPEHPQAARIPLVLVAPAGSPLVYGMALGEGDRPEHLPYVHAGFAVVAYDVSGAVPERGTREQVVDAARVFLRAEGGAADARAALDYALARLPAIDPQRVYVAGHSSAGTIALLVAERDPRVRACAAYAPEPDLVAHVRPATVAALASQIADYAAQLAAISPTTHAGDLHVPLFLFHADDDSNVPAAHIEAFDAAVRRTNPQVTFVRVPTGEHYQSMIDQGIPRAIEWFRQLAPAQP